MGGLSAETHKGHMLNSFVVKSMQQEAAESMEPIYQSHAGVHGDYGGCQMMDIVKYNGLNMIPCTIVPDMALFPRSKHQNGIRYLSNLQEKMPVREYGTEKLSDHDVH